MPAYPIETRIAYYKDDIARWEEYLSKIEGEDPLVENMVEILKRAVKDLEAEL